MTDDPELEQWQREWQGQTTAGPDADQLRRDMRKHDRREKTLSAMQVLLGAAVLVLCTKAFFLVTSDLMRLGLVLLGLILVVSTTRDLLRRLRRWRASTRTTADLVAVERRRLTNRVRYWRESAWVVTGLWCALAIVAVIDSIRNPFALDRLEGWFLSLAINLPLVLATIIFAWRTNRRAREQHRLLDEMEHPEGD